MKTKTVAETLYEAYPDNDILAVGPPRCDETIGDFADRVEKAGGDMLFLFLCREVGSIGGDLDAAERLDRLESAIDDIRSVRDAFAESAWHAHRKGHGRHLRRGGHRA